MANVAIPAYTADELTARIEDGSIDHIRLAATVAQIQKSVAALAEWANAQIQAQNAQAVSGASSSEPEGRRKR